MFASSRKKASLTAIASRWRDDRGGGVGGGSWRKREWAEWRALKLALPNIVELNLVQRCSQSTTGDSKVSCQSRFALHPPQTKFRSSDLWHTHLYRPILHTGCASSADHANPQRLIHPLSYKVIKIEVCWPLLFIYHQWVICSAHLYWLSLAEVWGKIKRQVNFRYWVAGCLPNVGSHCWFFFLITSGGPIFVDII